MFSDLADSNNFDYKYVIGFTENQYSQNDEHVSPTPSDHHVGYTSIALDYAERNNRGEHRNFMDHSFNLDRKKRYSVSKIHNNILDLMFEQTERIKSVTPSCFLSKSAMELHRSDSALSNRSDTSGKTSSSLPLIEVQQLPPLARQDHLNGSLTEDMFFDLPEIQDLRKKNRKNKHSKTVDSNKKNSKSVQEDKNLDRSWTRAQLLKTKKEMNKDGLTNDDTEEKTKLYKNNNRKDNNRKKVIFSQEKARIQNEVMITGINTDRSVDHKVVTFDEDIKTNKKFKLQRKLSFCQSSYHERAERERMNNVRRRHASQTKVGPLDFNKLRRQLSMGKSHTMLI